jgi:GNAT superfamily N-acetyltransferase
VTVRIRLAEPEDALEVAQLHVRSWQAAYRGLMPDDVLDGLRPEDRAGRYTFGSHDPNRPRTILAVEDGAVCGLATTAPATASQAEESDGEESDREGPGGELCALYVDPDWWGTGVGRRLIAEARAHLSDQGFTGAELWVLAGNTRAMRFYGIDGWSPDGSARREVVWGVPVDEVRFRRPLP